MKIMVAIGSLRFSGAERVLLALTNELRRKGHEIIYLVMQDDSKSPYKDSIEEGIDINIIDFNGNIVIKNIRRIFKIRKKIRDKKPDVIISFGYILNPIIIMASFLKRLPVIISERNDPNIEPDKKIYRILRRLTYPYANKLVVQTEEISKYFNKFMKNKIEIIENPITNNKLPQIYTGERKETIVTVGRLDQKQKNHLLLIRSFKEINKVYPNYKLIIYGEGEDRELIENEINLLGLKDAVNVPGQKDDIINLIREDGIFALSSEFEGMPNALIEAMAIGLPCISTDCGGGGAKALISSFENGIIVPRNDVNELTKAIKYYIDNKEIALGIGRKATEIRNRLSIEKIIMKWENLINNVIEK